MTKDDLKKIIKNCNDLKYVCDLDKYRKYKWIYRKKVQWFLRNFLDYNLDRIYNIKIESMDKNTIFIFMVSDDERVDLVIDLDFKSKYIECDIIEQEFREILHNKRYGMKKFKNIVNDIIHETHFIW